MVQRSHSRHLRRTVTHGFQGLLPQRGLRGTPGATHHGAAESRLHHQNLNSLSLCVEPLVRDIGSRPGGVVRLHYDFRRPVYGRQRPHEQRSTRLDRQPAGHRGVFWFDRYAHRKHLPRPGWDGLHTSDPSDEGQTGSRATEDNFLLI
jgi:hypothetical protein